MPTLIRQMTSSLQTTYLTSQQAGVVVSLKSCTGWDRKGFRVESRKDSDYADRFFFVQTSFPGQRRVITSIRPRPSQSKFIIAYH